MHTVLSDYTASITELKKSPTKVLKESHGEPVAILNHNKPEAYLINAKHWEAIFDALDDIELGELVKERMNEAEFEVTLDEL
ncbi:MAG: type II toxin-antitoxin system prevent-host-death family antitoxin [Lentisphaerae bacterium]|nr:type II toxin-antitoxin system prevent-host-death family antitoxin [Lentisphaerota bacterium]